MFNKVVQAAKLISLPDIYTKLKSLIDEPDYTMAEVAVLVGSDPGMAVRFLRAVNNPVNRRVNKIETVSHAVSLLGIRQVHDIVLGASVAEAFEGMPPTVMNMEKFWERSFQCAILTKQLALECDMIESDRLFTIGLLHDIGHLFMYLAIPDKSQDAASRAEELNRPIYQSENELLGFDYANIGGYMMRQWDLPDSFQEVTWQHTMPEKAEAFVEETAVLHLGAALVRSGLEGGLFGQGIHAVDPSVWHTTGLTEEKCIEVLSTASEQFEEAVAALF